MTLAATNRAATRRASVSTGRAPHSKARNTRLRDKVMQCVQFVSSDGSTEARFCDVTHVMQCQNGVTRGVVYFGGCKWSARLIGDGVWRAC